MTVWQAAGILGLVVLALLIVRYLIHYAIDRMSERRRWADEDEAMRRRLSVWEQIEDEEGKRHDA